MSNQKKLIEDILSLYDTILERKNLGETSTTLRSTLGSLGYKEKGSELTSGGEVNEKLTNIVSDILKQFNTNYPTETVTVTGGNDKFHKGLKYTSSHTTGNAIDVVISPYDSKSAAAFLNILNNTVKSTPGFTYIDEYTKPSKASTGGHYHLQYGKDTIQPTTSGDTQTTSSNTQTTDDVTTGSSGGARQFAKDLGGKILNVIGIKESFNPSSFGNNAKISRGKVLIPRSGNSKIKSSVSGKIVDNLNTSSCINQIVIEFNEGYLEYCGITNPSVKNGERVRVGESLGTTSYNVTVTLYSKRKEKQGISFDDEDKNETPKKKSDSFLVKIRQDLKNSGKETKKSQPETNSFLVKGYRDLKKSFKVDEDIKRIKKLL